MLIPLTSSCNVRQYSHSTVAIVVTLGRESGKWTALRTGREIQGFFYDIQ